VTAEKIDTVVAVISEGETTPVVGWANEFTGDRKVRRLGPGSSLNDEGEGQGEDGIDQESEAHLINTRSAHATFFPIPLLRTVDHRG
jgi:hypothetical protein